MLHGNSGPSARRWPKALMPVSIALVLLAAVTAGALSSSRPRGPAPMSQTPPSHPLPAVGEGTGGRGLPRAWRVIVQGECQPGAMPFGGRFEPGHVFFATPGAPLDFLADPPDAAGAFTCDERWDHAGGELNSSSATADGVRQTGCAPHEPGHYQLLWRTAPPLPAAGEGAATP